MGTLIFDVHFGNRSAVTEFLICDDFKSVLIAWFTCRDLRIIPADYPAPAQPVLPDPLLTSVRCAKTTASSAESLGLDSLPEQPTPQECRTIREKILADFADVFDSMDTLRPMVGSPMQIHVRPDAIPFAAHAARPIPFAWRAEVQSKLDEMVQQGVIALLGDTPSAWCHPLVIVPKSSDTLRPMVGSPMQIHVRPDAIPFAAHAARPIPFAWRAEVQSKLDEMVQQGVIALLGDTPSAWCHPLVIVPKSSGGIRICVDMTKLNKHVDRATYPLCTPKDAVSAIPPTARYFSTLDATHGYWQVPLEEDSQILTTFISPWGRFKFLRSPMGLVSTGDEYCRRGDVALSDIGQLQKVVDDIITYDDTFHRHVRRVVQILERCLQHGITLNAEKFQFAAAEVRYVGYVISHEGVAADPHKIAAIRDFAPPTHRQELRSFMGLANQLGEFVDDLSFAADPLRELLPTRHEFQWLWPMRRHSPRSRPP